MEVFIKAIEKILKEQPSYSIKGLSSYQAKKLSKHFKVTKVHKLENHGNENSSSEKSKTNKQATV